MYKKKSVKSAIMYLLVFVLAFAFCNVAALCAEGAGASGKAAPVSAGKVVYLNASQSGAGGDGSTSASAVKTLEAAYKALAGGDGTIVVCGNISVSSSNDAKTSPFSATNGNVCFTGKDPATGSLYKATITVKDGPTEKNRDYIPLFTPTTFEYLTFDACTNNSTQFVTGPSLTFGEGMAFLRNGEAITQTERDEIFVRLGDASSVITANYTQLSGAISSVYGGNEWQKVGNADNSQGSNIVISGTASVLVRLECGGNKKYVSRTDLTIDENAKVGSLNFSGYSNGNLKDVNVCISGGTVNTIFSQREQ